MGGSSISTTGDNSTALQHENERLEHEVAQLRAQLDESRETLRAIREGEVDALVIASPQGDRIFTLQSAEQPYRLLIEQMREGAVMLVPDGTIHYANRAFADMVGHPLEQVMGSAVQEYVAPSDRPLFAALLRQTQNGTASGEVSLCAADGRLLPVYLGLSTMVVNGVSSICLVATDLSEQKRTERVLASEEMHRAFFDLAAVGMAYVSPEGRIVKVNEKYAAISGYTREELLGMPVLDLTHPDDRESDRRHFERYLRGQLPVYESENRYLRKDGTARWVAVTARMVHEADGRPRYSVGIVEDTTKRKLAEEALRQSEERLNLTLEASSMGAFEVDLVKGRSRWNAVEFALLGLQPSDAPISPEYLFRFVHPEDVGSLRTQWELATKTGEFDAEFRIVRADGQERWLAGKGRFAFDATAGTEQGASRRPLRFLGVNYDITERKRTEEKLRKLNRTLRALNRSNQAMMRAADETEYVREVCAIVVKDCGHVMAWVGYAREDEARTVEAVAHAGDEQGYVQTARISWADTERGRGATGTAIRTGEVVVCNHMLTDARMRPWREEAAKRGYAASISLPLLDEGRAFGALIIYSSHPAPFSDEEVALLRELAGDLAQGIMSIRLRAAHARATEAMRESEERFRTMADGLPLIIWVHDVNGQLQFVNRTYYEFFGVAPEEVRGPNWQPLVHPDDVAAYSREFAACLRECRPFEAEVRVRRADGEWRWIKSWAQPSCSADGKLLRMVGTSADVTDAKQAEEALRQSERLYRAIGESINYGIWVCDAQGRNTYASDSLLKLVGITREQYAEFGWGRVLHPDDAEATITAWKDCVRTGGTWYHEHRYRGTDGQWHPILARGGPIRDERGEVTAWAGINLDISQMKQAEQALAAAKLIAEQAKTAAEHASKAKDHFLAVLSHELRTPLNPVLVTAAMLRDDPRLDADTREQLEVICRNVELEARLIDDLLDVTRIERGKVELDRRPIELRTVIQRAVEVCLPDIRARELRFDVDIPDGPYAVDADAARLQQVFWNLLKNAIKFTPPGGRVGIRCRRDGDGFVVAEVTDSGVGLEPAALGRIFNAFEQAERSITQKFGGLGLGLTISKAMVVMHGGHIEAHSPGLGQGATFTVRLPLLPDRAAVTASPPTDQAPPPNVPIRRLRILLVEDHGDTARIMIRLLSADGHEVQHAGDMASALTLAEKQTFELLLSDLGLPDGSGLDLLRSLRTKGIQVPAIALSGYGQESDAQQSGEAGFVAHLTKPVSLPKLEEVMAKVVGGASAL